MGLRHDPGLEFVTQPFSIDEGAPRRIARCGEVLPQKEHHLQASGHSRGDRVPARYLHQPINEKRTGFRCRIPVTDRQQVDVAVGAKAAIHG